MKLLASFLFVVCAVALPLSALGARPASPSLAFSPSGPWNAGPVPVGENVSQSFTLSFTGSGNTGPLTVQLTPTTYGFSIPSASDNCSGVTLSAKAPSCTLTVQFAPTSTGTVTAFLSAYGRKLTAGTINLTGTGQAATLPTLSINDPSLPYGTAITFTVTMSTTSTTPVTFSWATADGTAVSGSSCGTFEGTTDYIGGSGSGTIAANATSTTIAIDTCSTGPGNASGNTTFTLTISGASGATITKAVGTGTLEQT